MYSTVEWYIRNFGSSMLPGLSTNFQQKLGSLWIVKQSSRNFREEEILRTVTFQPDALWKDHIFQVGTILLNLYYTYYTIYIYHDSDYHYKA